MASPFGSPLDDLITQPGAGGDIARSAAQNPPLPGETPGDTQERVRKQSFAFASTQAVKARDLAAKGIPSYADDRGAVSPVTDETGTPLTGFDRRNRVGYDSQGNPRKVGFTSDGKPELGDPFAGIPISLDEKTGDQYQIAPGLPWRHVGTDETTKARVELDAQDRQIKRERSVLGMMESPEKQAVTALGRQARELEKSLKEMGHVFTPDTGPDEARAAILKTYDEQNAAPEANKTAWFSGGQLTPEAQQMRAEIAQKRTRALGLLDHAVQTGAQLQAHSDRMAGIDAARETANTQLLRNEIARMKADGQDTSELEKLVTSAQSQYGDTPEDAAANTQIAQQTGVHPSTAHAYKQAVAGQKPYAIEDGKPKPIDGKYEEGLTAAAQDGLIAPPAPEVMAAARTADAKYQELVKQAGSNQKLKAFIATGVKSYTAFQAGALASGALTAVEPEMIAGGTAIGGPIGAAVVPLIGHGIAFLAGMFGANKALDALSKKAAEYSDTMASINASIALQPGAAQLGNLAGMGPAAAKSVYNLSKAAGQAAAKATMLGESGAKAAAGFLGKTAAGATVSGAAFEAAIRPGFDWAVDEIGGALGMKKEGVQGPTLGSVAETAGLAVLLAGAHLRQNKFNTAQSVDIVKRGMQAVIDGKPLSDVLSSAEVDAFHTIGAKLRTMKATGHDLIADPEKFKIEVNQTLTGKDRAPGDYEKADKIAERSRTQRQKDIRDVDVPTDLINQVIHTPITATTEPDWTAIGKKHGISADEAKAEFARATNPPGVVLTRSAKISGVERSGGDATEPPQIEGTPPATPEPKERIETDDEVAHRLADAEKAKGQLSSLPKNLRDHAVGFAKSGREQTPEAVKQWLAEKGWNENDPRYLKAVLENQDVVRRSINDAKTPGKTTEPAPKARTTPAPDTSDVPDATKEAVAPAWVQARNELNENTRLLAREAEEADAAGLKRPTALEQVLRNRRAEKLSEIKERFGVENPEDATIADAWRSVHDKTTAGTHEWEDHRGLREKKAAAPEPPKTPAAPEPPTPAASRQQLLDERNRLVIEELPKHPHGSNGQAETQRRIAEIDKQIKALPTEPVILGGKPKAPESPKPPEVSKTPEPEKPAAPPAPSGGGAPDSARRTKLAERVKQTGVIEHEDGRTIAVIPSDAKDGHFDVRETKNGVRRIVNDPEHPYPSIAEAQAAAVEHAMVVPPGERKDGDGKPGEVAAPDPAAEEKKDREHLDTLKRHLSNVTHRMTEDKRRGVTRPEDATYRDALTKAIAELEQNLKPAPDANRGDLPAVEAAHDPQSPGAQAYRQVADWFNKIGDAAPETEHVRDILGGTHAFDNDVDFRAALRQIAVRAKVRAGGIPLPSDPAAKQFWDDFFAEHKSNPLITHEKDESGGTPATPEKEPGGAGAGDALDGQGGHEGVEAAGAVARVAAHARGTKAFELGKQRLAKILKAHPQVQFKEATTEEAAAIENESGAWYDTETGIIHFCPELIGKTMGNVEAWRPIWKKQENQTDAQAAESADPERHTANMVSEEIIHSLQTGIYRKFPQHYSRLMSLIEKQHGGEALATFFRLYEGTLKTQWEIVAEYERALTQFRDTGDFSEAAAGKWSNKDDVARMKELFGEQHHAEVEESIKNLREFYHGDAPAPDYSTEIATATPEKPVAKPANKGPPKITGTKQIFKPQAHVSEEDYQAALDPNIPQPEASKKVNFSTRNGDEFSGTYTLIDGRLIIPNTNNNKGWKEDAVHYPKKDEDTQEFIARVRIEGFNASKVFTPKMADEKVEPNATDPQFNGTGCPFVIPKTDPEHQDRHFMVAVGGHRRLILLDEFPNEAEAALPGFIARYQTQYEGISQQRAETMPNARLVMVVTQRNGDPVTPEQEATLITELDGNDKQVIQVAGRASSAANNLSEEAIRQAGAIFDKASGDSVLKALQRTTQANRDLVEELRDKSTVLTKDDAARMVDKDTGTLNEEGAKYVRFVLLAKIVGGAKALADLEDAGSLQEKFTNAIGQIYTVMKRGGPRTTVRIQNAAQWEISRLTGKSQKRNGTPPTVAEWQEITRSEMKLAGVPAPDEGDFALQRWLASFLPSQAREKFTKLVNTFYPFESKDDVGLFGGEANTEDLGMSLLKYEEEHGILKAGGVTPPDDLFGDNGKKNAEPEIPKPDTNGLFGDENIKNATFSAELKKLLAVAKTRPLTAREHARVEELEKQLGQQFVPGTLDTPKDENAALPQTKANLLYNDLIRLARSRGGDKAIESAAEEIRLGHYKVARDLLKVAGHNAEADAVMAQLIKKRPVVRLVTDDMFAPPEKPTARQGTLFATRVTRPAAAQDDMFWPERKLKFKWASAENGTGELVAEATVGTLRIAADGNGGHKLTLEMKTGKVRKVPNAFPSVDAAQDFAEKEFKAFLPKPVATETVSRTASTRIVGPKEKADQYTLHFSGTGKVAPINKADRKLATSRPNETRAARASIRTKYLPTWIEATLFPHQADGANMALDAFERGLNHLNADGTGAGKTMQQLAVAAVRALPPVLRFKPFAMEDFEAIMHNRYGEDWARHLTEPEKLLQHELLSGPMQHSDKFNLWVNSNPENPGLFEGSYKLQHSEAGSIHMPDKAFKRLPASYASHEEAMEGAERVAKDALEKGLVKADRVLISTKNSNLVDTVFAKDGEMLGLTSDTSPVQMFRYNGDDPLPGRIYVCTHTDIQRGLVKPGDFDTVIMDEAHIYRNLLLKQKQSAIGMMGDNVVKQAAHVMFATATPTDKPAHLWYLRSVFDRDLSAVFQDMGMELQRVMTKDGEEIATVKFRGNMTAAQRDKQVEKLYSELTRKGLMIQREVPLDNTVIKFKEVHIKDEDYLHADELFDRIKQDMDRKRKYMFSFAVAANVTRGFLEQSKVDETMREISNGIQSGQQVLVYADRIKDGESGSYTEGVDGTINKMVALLEAKYGKGSVGKLYGTEPKAKQQADVSRFQNGEIKILIATPSSGGTGLSLDDIYGDSPRKLIMMTPPFSSLDFVQMCGRINRLTTMSKGEVVVLFSEHPIDTWGMDITALKLNQLGAAVTGDIQLIKPLEERRAEIDINDAAEFAHIMQVPLWDGNKMKPVRSKDEARRILETPALAPQAWTAIFAAQNIANRQKLNTFGGKKMTEAEIVRVSKSGKLFSDISPGHARTEDYFDEAVSEGALFPEHVVVLRAVLAQCSGELLGRIAYGFVPKGKKSILGLGGGTYQGAGMLQLKKKGASGGVVRTREGRQVKLVSSDMASVFLHELGHVAYFVLLAPNERRYIARTYAKQGGKPGTEEHFNRGFETGEQTPEQRTQKRFSNAAYGAKNVYEFFAESFAKHMLGHRVPEPILDREFASISSWIKNYVDGLRRLGGDRRLRDIFEEGAQVKPEATGVDYAQPAQNAVVMVAPLKDTDMLYKKGKDGLWRMFSRKDGKPMGSGTFESEDAARASARRLGKTPGGLVRYYMGKPESFVAKELERTGAGTQLSDLERPGREWLAAHLNGRGFRLTAGADVITVAKSGGQWSATHTKGGKPVDVQMFPEWDKALDYVHDAMPDTGEPRMEVREGAKWTPLFDVMDSPEFKESVKPEVLRAGGVTAPDREYLDAVERGDTKTAQRMVDEAAKAAGYNTVGWHGNREGGAFEEFSDSLLGTNTASENTTLGHFFAEKRDTAQTYNNEHFFKGFESHEQMKALHDALEAADQIVREKTKAAGEKYDPHNGFGGAMTWASAGVIQTNAFTADVGIRGMIYVMENSYGIHSWPGHELMRKFIKGFDYRNPDASMVAIPSKNGAVRKFYLKTDGSGMFGAPYLISKQALHHPQRWMKEVAERVRREGDQPRIAFRSEEETLDTTQSGMSALSLDDMTDAIIYKKDVGAKLAKVEKSHIWIIPKASQIKSADPVTYDADGNVIPLSERFNPESNSILRAGGVSKPDSRLHEGEVQAYLDFANVPAKKQPEAKAALAQVSTASTQSYALPDGGGMDRIVARERAKQAAVYHGLICGDADAVKKGIADGVPVSSVLAQFVRRDIPSFDIRGAVISCPRDVAAFMAAHRTPFFESVKILVLDENDQVIHSQIVTVGALNESVLTPREIVGIIEHARITNPGVTPGGFIISHNHPSGKVAPSDADSRVTRLLEAAAEMIGVPLVDHVITNGKDSFSFREMGMINSSGKAKLRTPLRLPVLPVPEYDLADWEAVPRMERTNIGEIGRVREITQTLKTADPKHLHLLLLDTRLGLIGVNRYPLGTDMERLAKDAAVAGAYSAVLSFPSITASPVSGQSSNEEYLLTRKFEAAMQKAWVKVTDAVTTTGHSAREAGTLTLNEDGGILRAGGVTPPDDTPEGRARRAAAAGQKGQKDTRADAKAARAAAAKEPKGIIAATLEAAKAVGASLRDWWSNLPEATEYKIAKGEWLGTGGGVTISKLKVNGRQYAAMEARDLTHAIMEQFPNRLDREAISRYMEADGDMAVLKDQEAKSKKHLQPVYKRAQELNDAAKAMAKTARTFFEEKGEQAQSVGLLGDLLENYVTHFVDRSSIPRFKQAEFIARLMGDLAMSKLKTRFDHAIKRHFATMFDLEQAGYRVVSGDIAEIMGAYSQSANNTLADRVFVRDLTKLKAKDGRPLAEVSGYARPLDEEARPDAPLLIKPFAHPEGTADYKTLDHPALRKWKWIAKDSGGNDVLMEGELVLHPEIWQDLKNTLGKSALNSVPVVKAVSDFQSWVKGLMLSFSAFHFVQEGTHAIGHGVNPFKVHEIDMHDPITRELVNAGLMLVNYDAKREFGEGLSASGMEKTFSKIGLGKLGAFNDTLTGFLFERYIPGLKIAMAKRALERNLKRFKRDLDAGKITRQQIAQKTAQQANDAFGEQNNLFAGNNPTRLHAERLAFLAPDFLKSRAKFFADAFRKHGAEQRRALLLLALILAISAKLIERMLTGDNKWEKPFSVVTPTREYELRSVPGDVIALLQNTRQFVMGRVSPVISRTTIEAITGRDWRGMKRTVSQQLGDLAKAPLPLPVRAMVDPDAADISTAESLISSSGIRTRRFSAITQARILGYEWQKKQGKEDIGEVHPPSKYVHLKNALEDGNTASAGETYKRLLATMPKDKLDHGFRESMMKPFSGKKESEAAFARSLTGEDRATYNAALRSRDAVMARFTRISGALPTAHHRTRVPLFQGF